MYTVNNNYLNLQGSYLFSEIAHRISAYKEQNPDKKIISLGIGDVTQPLVPAIIDALHSAVDEMGTGSGFHGYGPEQGYEFLRDLIAEHDYRSHGCDIRADEIFISDGAKCDVGNIQEIFGADNRVAICDPVYPVYADTNVMAGRAGAFDPALGGYKGLIYLPCTEENGFVPDFPSEVPDIIYLCFPNNPTGMTISKDQLQEWVDYARRNRSVIIYDAAYEAYISEKTATDDLSSRSAAAGFTPSDCTEPVTDCTEPVPDCTEPVTDCTEPVTDSSKQNESGHNDLHIPHSIYECDGARECAIEIRSFSKNAGFTGLRLGFTVIPEELKCEGISLRSLWNRRHGTKYNGAPYIVQKAGAAVYSNEGRQQLSKQIGYYMNNARVIRESLRDYGYTVYGGVNAPYLWLKVPGNSWDFFDHLLKDAQVVGTPGSGFGSKGEGFFRLTAFGTHEDTLEALSRIKEL